MSPNDPRHGTYAGASAHWRHGVPVCLPCSTVAARRRKLNRLRAHEGNPGVLPSLGTVRRLQALQALGYGYPRIASETGLYEKTLRNPTYRGRGVYRATAEAVAEAYERLCMTPAVGPYATRGRNIAQRKGYLPPLAWDDIDNPDEQPLDWRYQPATRGETFAELTERDVTVSEACRVLRVSREGLEKWADRTGNRAAFNVMAGRETAVFEYRNQHSRSAS